MIAAGMMKYLPRFSFLLRKLALRVPQPQFDMRVIHLDLGERRSKLLDELLLFCLRCD